MPDEHLIGLLKGDMKTALEIGVVRMREVMPKLRKVLAALIGTAQETTVHAEEFR
jgi:hypothetical protein